MAETMNILVLNAGSASLKFELIALEPGESADEGRKLASGSIEHIGDDALLSELEGKKAIHQQKVAAQDYEEATRRALEWLAGKRPERIDLVGHRVVHGADLFDAPVRIDETVMAAIESLEEIAPLHNQSALAAIRAARSVLGPEMVMVAAFDTVFHRDIPEYARLYAIEPELAERHKIRRYGFHGLSHQYMTGRYARIVGRPVDSVRIVTLHLESGCSAAAISAGHSVDTSMGFTPLEGLVMGMRSGDIDPAVVGYLARKENVALEEIERRLNKQSGLLGLSGCSHDTRVLMEHYEHDEKVRLAIEVFCYRARKYVGAYLAALNGAEAVVFGGGISENTLFVRERICAGFGWCGLTLDPERNQRTIDREGRVSTDSSNLHAYVIPVEEGLQIAFEAIKVAI